MSAEFSGRYGGIRVQFGANQDDRRSSGGYQSEGHIIFQSMSDTISRNIFQINGNVQTLERIIKQLGNQLKELPYDKLLCIQQATNKLSSDTTACLSQIINLQGGSVSERESSTSNKFPMKSPKNSFLFSSPEPKPRPLSIKETLEIADDEVSFLLSERVAVKKNFYSTNEHFRKQLLHGQKTSNDFKATWSHSLKQNIKTTSPFTSSPSNVTPLGDLNCHSCMATNEAADQKFSQCSGKNNAPAEALGRQSLDTTQANSLAQRFAPAAGSWERTSCKCVACSKTKPFTKKTGNTSKDKQEIDMKVKLGALKDTWECTTCLIRSKNDLNKCAACQTNRPGESSNDDLKMKFAAPSGSWECPTRMVQNKATHSKCVACATSKPGASSNNDLKLKFAEQASCESVVENQNSMGGEEMDADSNNNHDQGTFPQAGGFNFTGPTPGSASGLFPAGTSGTPGGNEGGFNFSAGSGTTSSFPFANTNTPSGGFNFGAPSTAGSSPFVFGGAPTPTNGPTNSSSTTGLFNFGGATTNPVLKRQSIVGQNSEQPALFSIGASQTPPSNRVFKKAVRRTRR